MDEELRERINRQTDETNKRKKDGTDGRIQIG